MPKYAYLNAAGDVIATIEKVVDPDTQQEISVPLDVATAQATYLARGGTDVITQRIDDAPDELLAKGSNGTFHQLIGAQAGTDIAHYTLVDFIDHQKAARLQAIDERTRDLSFTTPFVHATKPFVLGAMSHVLMVSVAIRENLLIYPLDIPAADGTSWSANTALDLEALLFSAHGTVKAIADAGQVLRAAIIAATTQAELDAVVDDR